MRNALQNAIFPCTVLMLLSTGWAFAQFGYPEFARRRAMPSEWADRNFSVCRLMYTSVRSEPSGSGWTTDYPYAEINFMIRLSELTKTPVSFNERHEPNHFVVRLTDDALFECPFMIASDVGTIGLTAAESERLRVYLLKGGFLWVDDFWGTAAWNHWSRQIATVLPPAEYPIEDIRLDDPIFRAQFEVLRVPQITNIRF